MSPAAKGFGHNKKSGWNPGPLKKKYLRRIAFRSSPHEYNLLQRQQFENKKQTLKIRLEKLKSLLQKDYYKQKPIFRQSINEAIKHTELTLKSIIASNVRDTAYANLIRKEKDISKSMIRRWRAKGLNIDEERAKLSGITPALLQAETLRLMEKELGIHRARAKFTREEEIHEPSQIEEETALSDIITEVKETPFVTKKDLSSFDPSLAIIAKDKYASTITDMELIY